MSKCLKSDYIDSDSRTKRRDKAEKGQSILTILYAGDATLENRAQLRVYVEGLRGQGAIANNVFEGVAGDSSVGGKLGSSALEGMPVGGIVFLLLQLYVVLVVHGILESTAARRLQLLWS